MTCEQFTLCDICVLTQFIVYVAVVDPVIWLFLFLSVYFRRMEDASVCLGLMD